MKRRGFLGLLASVPAAAVLSFRMDASTPAFVEHKEAVIFEKVEGTEEDLLELAKEMLRLMVRSLDGRTFRAVDFSKIGQGNLAHQSSINLSDYKEAGDDVLEAAAIVLSNQVLEHRATTFGTLELPLNIESAVRIRDRSGVSLRALRDYNIMSDRYELRVDVLYG